MRALTKCEKTALEHPGPWEGGSCRVRVQTRRRSLSGPGRLAHHRHTLAHSLVARRKEKSPRTHRLNNATEKPPPLLLSSGDFFPRRPHLICALIPSFNVQGSKEGPEPPSYTAPSTPNSPPRPAPAALPRPPRCPSLPYASH